MSATVLVADDDFDNRMIAREALECAGFSVTEAATGDEALARALRERPAILLLDLSMPVLSGWEVARRLRAAPEGDGIAIVAFTAHALRGDDLKAFEAGCDDYVAKPCRPSELVRRIRRWSAGRAERKPGGPQ